MGRRPAAGSPRARRARVAPLAVGAAALLALAVAAGGDAAARDGLLAEARERVARAEAASAAGDARGAVATAREALLLLGRADAIEPRGTEAPALGVEAALLALDGAAARRWFDLRVARDPSAEESPEVHWLHALVRLRLEERPDLALASLDRMAALDPGARAEARDRLLARVLAAEADRRLAEEDHAGVVAVYRRAVDLARRRGDGRMEVAALRNLGLALQMDDRYAEAVAVFRGLREREPENPFWAWRAAVNLANDTRWADAVPLYEATIRLPEAGKAAPADVPEMAPVHLRLANCRRILAGAEADPRARAALLEQARRGIERHMRLLPTDARGPYWMGVLLHEELERPYDAIPFFQRAYALDPVCDASLRNLVQIHARHPPPPGTSEEAWTRRRVAQERELAANAAEREALRRKRASGPARDDGCE